MTNITGAYAKCLTYVAEATLTKRYAVKIGTAVNGMVAPTAVTDVTLGILADSGVTGDHLPVCVFGEVEAIAGAAVTSGTWLTIDSTGRVIAAATTSYVIGFALEDVTTANSYVKIFVQRTGLPKV